MKKGLFSICIIVIVMTTTVQKTEAQIPILEIIQGGVKKVIKAVDLKIQRLQNKTIWLQNAEKTLENEMSKLKLKEISDWGLKQKELYANYFDELWKVKNALQTYQNVKDYKLYISADAGPESLFLQQESFNDTFVELLFIGDIDRDGKPDFIFGANRDYEEERVILYLSSKAEKGKIIKNVSEIAVQFDC